MTCYHLAHVTRVTKEMLKLPSMGMICWLRVGSSCSKRSLITTLESGTPYFSFSLTSCIIHVFSLAQVEMFFMTQMSSVLHEVQQQADEPCVELLCLFSARSVKATVSGYKVVASKHQCSSTCLHLYWKGQAFLFSLMSSHISPPKDFFSS